MAAKRASKRKPGRKFLLVGKDTPFQYQEAFKSLRTNLKFLAVGKACKKMILTSAIPGEGKSSVAINLAVSLAAVSYTHLDVYKRQAPGSRQNCG